MDEPRDPGSLLPLTHLSYHIAISLRDAPLHGYAIIKNVKERSEGAVSPGTGSFYSALARMEQEGVVEETSQPDTEAASDARRRYYGLTTFGREVLMAETARLRALVAWADAPAGG